MHANGGRGKRVVGREEERSPVLTILVGCFWRAGKDVVPSALEARGLGMMSWSREGETWGRTRGY